MDIAPSVLYMLNVPVPKDMDGNAFVHALDKSFVEGNPVQYSEPMPSSEVSETEDTYSQKDKDEIKERLRGLGYIE
jgi:hypothetical protein